MSIIRAFGNNFQITDWTQELLVVPNQYGKVQQLALFDTEPLATHTANFEVINQSIGLIGDKVRGERNNVSKDYTRLIKAYPVPHFPLDDAIKPEDIQGKSAYAVSYTHLTLPTTPYV